MVGPWQVDKSVAGEDFFAVAPVIDFAAIDTALAYPILQPLTWAQPLIAIGQAQRFIAGFTTGRIASRAMCVARSNPYPW